MTTHWRAAVVLCALGVVACGDNPSMAGPERNLNLVPVPDGPSLERIVVCKVGGEGSYDFTYSGDASGSFSLNPGECWEVGLFGGDGATIDITEVPRPGHEVVSIFIDQFIIDDEFLTGTNTATGVVGSGNPPRGAVVYFNNRVVPMDEGCTPGYWKTHAGFGPQDDSWPPSGYAPGDLFNSVFTGATTLAGGLTLHGALGLGGGPRIAGAERNLARAATAALLNAAHSGVSFPMSEADVITAVNDALASQDRTTMLELAEQLDILNNAGCPLN